MRVALYEIVYRASDLTVPGGEPSFWDYKRLWRGQCNVSTGSRDWARITHQTRNRGLLGVIYNARVGILGGFPVLGNAFTWGWNFFRVLYDVHSESKVQQLCGDEIDEYVSVLFGATTSGL